MKNLYNFLGIIIACSVLLSGCKTLFDVVPTKAINFPIDLKKLTVGPLLDINKQPKPNLATISYFSPDISLKYGVVAFYDSSSAIAFVRERKIIGAVQPIPLSKITDVVSASVGFDNTRGQYLFITPFAYKSDNIQDSIDIFTKQNYSKVFSSKGYVQLKISPWTYITGLPATTYDDGHVLLAVDGKLHLISFNLFENGPIYNYELDNTNRWIPRGNFPNKFSVGSITGSTPRSILGLTNAYFFNNEYHLFATTYKTERNAYSITGSGEIVADQDFHYKSYEKFMDRFSYYTFVNVQDNRIVALRQTPETISPYTGYSTNLTTNKTLVYDITSLDFNKAMVIYHKTFGARFVANTNGDPNTWNTYDLDNKDLKKLATKKFSESDRLTSYGNLASTISQADHAFILNGLQNINKVEIFDLPGAAINQPWNSSRNLDWFPARAAYNLNGGFSFEGYIWFFVNKTELWKINLNKIFDGSQQIDFNKDVTPIYVTPQ
jgi:hypothetical protein